MVIPVLEMGKIIVKVGWGDREGRDQEFVFGDVKL